ncbi:MAG: putative rane protein [Thermoleophilia bacterium]|nr:putative rane protein [Thermoleophilia bacterium]
MLRSGPIAFFLHGLFEYVAAVVCLLAPFALDFRSDAATIASIVAGIAFLAVTVTSDGPRRLVERVPIVVHVVLDVVLAAALIAAPWLLGFSDERAPKTFFVTVGVFHLLMTLGTRFVDDPSGVGALAKGTSVDLEAGEHTVLDD